MIASKVPPAQGGAVALAADPDPVVVIAVAVEGDLDAAQPSLGQPTGQRRGEQGRVGDHPGRGQAVVGGPRSSSTQPRGLSSGSPPNSRIVQPSSPAAAIRCLANSRIA